MLRLYAARFDVSFKGIQLTIAKCRDKIFGAITGV